MSAKTKNKSAFKLLTKSASPNEVQAEAKTATSIHFSINKNGKGFDRKINLWSLFIIF